ncbi:MAG: hypothetical protein AVDCRST_MAG35-2293 [uncultured Quadrisphaera sp.]|uniref:Uncharacterized protein n=1 Tax=uncultured Quadrisphaera sp. TaxID=904978 RepID=A0A6J4PYW4_9ACTN|nr:MAG: hypothetical protein AVDCRST_MAG35-2293 [uncultured Quadrisphaera sp.]
MSAAGPGEHTRSIVVRGARVNDLRGVEERQAALGIAHRSSPVPTASLRLQCQGAHD